MPLFSNSITLHAWRRLRLSPVAHLPVRCFVTICLLFGVQPAKAVVAGTSADWRLYPWLAQSVGFSVDKNQWIPMGCSSVIIDQQYALTAAHCLHGPYPSIVRFPYGQSVNVARSGLLFPNGQIIEVVQEIAHPDYKLDSLILKPAIGIVSESVADIGVQRLAAAISTVNGSQIYNIFNNELPQNVSGSVAKLLGWGPL